LIIADEPTTALDVTVQAEVLEILRECARDDGVAVMLITHNMGVVWQLCDSVYVMESGQLVEGGPAKQVLSAPAKTYTRKLLAALPDRAVPRQPICLPTESGAA
jgi:ABC-type dipeptide/oligopeptide/nickel transport system ATPase component